MNQNLTVALVAPIFNNMPVWAAEHLGLYRGAGLDVGVKVLYGVGNVTTSLREGTSEIGIGTPESVLADLGGDDGLMIVAGNTSKLNNGLIARRGIDSVEALRGCTIGVSHPTEGTALLVREMLAAHGLRLGDDYDITAIGVASKRWEAILDGTLDAGLQTPPHKYLAQDLGYPNLGDVSDYVPDYQFTTVNVRRQWAVDNRAALTAFLGCLAVATQWLYDEPAEATQLAAKALGSSEEHARRDYEHFARTRSVTPDLQLSVPGMAKVVSVMIEAGTLAATSTASDRVDLSYLPAPQLVPSVGAQSAAVATGEVR